MLAQRFLFGDSLSTLVCSVQTLNIPYHRNGRDENLLINTRFCKRLAILQVGFAQGVTIPGMLSCRANTLDPAAANAYNPLLEKLDDRLSKYIQGKPVRVNGKPRASGIMDTVRSFPAL
jgi:acid phosphatase